MAGLHQPNLSVVSVSLFETPEWFPSSTLTAKSAVSHSTIQQQCPFLPKRFVLFLVLSGALREQNTSTSGVSLNGAVDG